MQLIEEHRTPDGLLTFKVGRNGNDTCLGFDGYSWHTHGDILSELTGLTENDAIRQFIDDLINNRSIIAIARIGDKIRDVRVAESTIPGKYKPDNENIEFRFWNGNPAA